MKIKDSFISKNVSYDKILVSNDRPDLVDFSKLTMEQIMTAKLTAMTCIDPIIDRMGKHIFQSFVRPEDLNRAVGGDINSGHRYGSTVDLTPVEVDFWSVVFWIYHNADIDWRKLLIYPKQNFYHIEINTPYKGRKRVSYITLDRGDTWKEYFGDKNVKPV